MKKYTFALLFSCLLCIYLFPVTGAAEDIYTISQIDHRNGLSNSSVNSLFEDRDHILWIATWDGLNMYDGSECRVFNYSKRNNGNSIGNNVTRQVEEDGRGDIWISTMEGISRYDKSSGKFSNYFYRDSRFGNVSEKDFRLLVNRKGALYSVSRKLGLSRYDSTSDRFIDIRLGRSPGDISVAIFDDDNRLWILDYNSNLDVYVPVEGGYRKIKTIRQRGIYKLFYVAGRLFFIANGKDLYRVNDNLQEEQVVTLQSPVFHMAYYKKQYVFGNTDKGYQVYDRDFKPSGMLDSIMRPMKEMTINTLCASGELLWCGIDGSGIIRITARNRLFYGWPLHNGNNNEGLHLVRAFCQVNDDLWVGTKGNGIITLKGFFSNMDNPVYGSPITAPASISNNYVFAIVKGPDSLVYIGTDGRGLCLYDMRDRKFVRWENIEGATKASPFKFVYAILFDTDGSAWVGTNGEGLVHLKIVRKPGGGYALQSFRRYLFNGTAEGPANDVIYSLAKGPGNDLWVACRYGGLNLLDKTTGHFRLFKAFTYENSLSHNDVLSLYKDGTGRLWIGTSYGLNWMMEKDAALQEPVFHKFTSDDGLPNNTIHAITGTADGNIWASTNKGLVHINPKTMSILRFQEADGLQCNEFSDGAVWTSTDNWIFFGGIYGFTYFPAQSIEGGDARPNLLIKDLQLAGKLYNDNAFIILSPDATEERHFNVSPTDNYFELKARTINYLSGEKAEYNWFLEGYDKVWHYSGNNGNISYYNIQPGDYTLRIKWSNGEGRWMEGAAFTIHVRQYFWLRWPAILFYLVISGAGIYTYMRYRKGKLEMRHQLEIEKQLRLKDEALHHEQLAFFTNITHELQTPLTLINSSVDRFLYKEQHKASSSGGIHFISLVRQQTSRLIYLVNQLLDFRKAEAGFLNNRYTYINISWLLSEIAMLFEPLGIQGNRLYTVSIDENVKGYCDKDKLEKIAFNLLSNAFKHSGYGQEIFFTMQHDVLANSLKIVVTNSGCRLTDEQLQQLFERFFVMNEKPDEQYSHGIGLTFTRQLVELLKGNISVSREDSWISFTVQIPLTIAEMPADGAPADDTQATPSYLLQAITAKTGADTMIPVMESNKRALIDTLDQQAAMTILVVDDEHGIRYLLKDILNEQYIVYEAENGKQALDVLANGLPDLIISDVMMPEMDGLALCRKVKNTPETCHIPFILLSAKSAVEDSIEGYDSGADAYIPKPFHTRHLQIRVKKLLEYRAQIREIMKQNDIGIAINKEEIPDADKQFLQQMLKAINDNMDNIDLDAGFLEKTLAMSKIQLYRKMKSLSNMTPSEFIKHIRLQKAIYYLETSQFSVAEIAYKVGFNNHSYFFREFKKRYNCSPKEYRVKQQL